MKARRRGFTTIAAALTAVAVVVLVAGTSAVSAAKNLNTLSVIHTNYPGPSSPGVTYGKDVGSTLTVANVGNNPWNKVLVTAPAPSTSVTTNNVTVTTKAKLAYTNIFTYCVTPSTGGVGTSGTVTCNLGTLAPHTEPPLKFIFVWTVPSAGSSTGCGSTAPCLVNTITVTGSEGTAGPDGQPSSHEDTFARPVTTKLLDSPDTDKEQAGTYALTACTPSVTPPTLTTNPAVDRSHGISTAVCAPVPNGPVDDPGLIVAVTESAKLANVGKTEVSQICIPQPPATCSTPNYTPFNFGTSVATFVFTVSNKSFTGQLTGVAYDGTEDGSNNFLPVSTDPNVFPHLVGTFVVDNQAQTTTFVIANNKNGRYTGT